jgi:RNA polymerase II subunit A small phosphatase-like protein
VSDAEQIARMLDADAATSSGKDADARRGDGGDARDVAVKARTRDGAGEGDADGRRSTAWGALVAYLRCCVAPESTPAAEGELERAEAESVANVVHQTTKMSCVPCAKPPQACLEDGFVLHEGDPFIGEPDCACDATRWEKYATKDVFNVADGAPTHKPCLVLDLDETLVHSSFKPVPSSDFIVPVEIDGKMTDVYVLKRPWVDLFLREVAKDWEIVVFTASLPKYANPVVDLLDVGKTVRWRLFRRHCYAFQGNYVKDLTSLGRDLSQTVIVDNSPYSYAFHPQNAFPISSFIDNPNDNQLLNAIPYLRELARTKDVVEFLKKSRGCMPRQPYFSRTDVEEPAYDRFGNAVPP